MLSNLKDEDDNFAADDQSDDLGQTAPIEDDCVRYIVLLHNMVC